MGGRNKHSDGRAEGGAMAMGELFPEEDYA